MQEVEVHLGDLCAVSIGSRVQGQRTQLAQGCEIDARLENVKLHVIIEELLRIRRRLRIACFSG